MNSSEICHSNSVEDDKIMLRSDNEKLSKKIEANKNITVKHNPYSPWL